MRKLLEEVLKVEEDITARLMMNPLLRKKVNRELAALPSYASEVLRPVKEVLDKNGIVMIQEDNTEFEGILAGADGKANIAISSKTAKRGGKGVDTYTPYDNSVLVLTWHKMESGSYEVVAYLS